MQIWPAIDILGGRCVRLQQGDYHRETVFGDDPLAMARGWVEQGAECLHLVDLDGARDGQVTNRQAIERVVKAVSVPCELGGGIRDEATIRAWLELGLDRLVVGTRALRDADWFRRMVRAFPRRLALGIDARDGRAATDGWLNTSDVSATDLARSFQGEPIASIIYTDISKDGMLSGPNLSAMAAMKEAVDCPVVASGGITALADVVQLAEIGMDGCIIGRALYEGRLSLPAALAALRERRATAGGASGSE
jgi:phosphoribosylformimino-5-aminoimidazole carboxamide ribotide isomerase